MRIGVITTTITLIGMTLLWLVVSTNAVSMVKNDITNQMTDAVGSAGKGSSVVADEVRSLAAKSAAACADSL